MEYGFESHPYLNPTHRFTLALQLSPAVVSITKTTIAHNPIFRSLHRYYESEPFVKVGLKNISDADLPVNVSLFVPTMMDNPHSETITLPPKSEEEYDIGISFSSDVLTSKKSTFDSNRLYDVCTCSRFKCITRMYLLSFILQFLLLAIYKINGPHIVKKLLGRMTQRAPWWVMR